MKAQSWCFKNKIIIYIVPLQYKKECHIEVSDNGTIIRSPNTYKNQSVACDKIWDLYLFYYNSRANKKNN